MQEYYEDCLSKEKEEDDPFTSKGGVIDRDINRTYPQNEVFSEIGGVGQESLRRVLLAFANHNKEVALSRFQFHPNTLPPDIVPNPNTNGASRVRSQTKRLCP